MSQISTLYDALVTKIAALYPNHKRIPNPYTPSENNALILNKGWGIAFQSAQNSEEHLGCYKLSIERGFTVVHTRRYIALESDVTTKAAVEKDLFEDQFLLMQSLETDITLSGQEVTVKWVSDGGLEFVSSGNDKFLLISSALQMKYIETLTP